MTRGERRARRQKAVAKAYRMALDWRLPPDFIDRWVQRHADNLRACSCSVCKRHNNDKGYRKWLARKGWTKHDTVNE